MNDVFLLYVILKPAKKTLAGGLVIQRLETVAEVQADVKNLFINIHADWTSFEQVPFTPSYKTEEAEVFFHEEFTASDDFKKAASNRQQFDEFKKDQLDKKDMTLKAILGIHKNISDETTTYYLQQTDRRHILDRKKWYPMVYLQNKYSRMDDHALTIGDHLTAVVTPTGKLLFRSFRDASQLLDLDGFFKAATDGDIKNILEIEKVANPPDDIQKIIDLCDDTMRRRFSIIQYEGTLAGDNVKVQTVAAKAKHIVGLEIKMKGKPPSKMLFPTQKEQLKLFLKFLCQDFYESILTGDRCVSNSHRKLS